MRNIARNSLRNIWRSAAALALAGTCFSAGYAPSQAADIVEGPRVHWNYSLWGKPRANTTFMENLGPWLSERTGGSFTLQLHWGTLSQPRSNLDGLKLGAFQGALSCFAYYPGKVPAHTGLDLPFLPITKLAQLRAVSDDYFADETLKKESAKWNAQYYMAALLPMYEAVGKGTAPKSLADWKGMRIRAAGEHGKAMQRLGVVPTSVPAPDVYVSMDRGLIEAVAFPYYAHDSYRTWELGDWFTRDLALGTLSCVTFWNSEAYAALPPQYQALLQEFPNDPQGYPAQIATLNEESERLPNAFKERGLQEIDIAPEERADFVKIGGEPIWAEWVARMTDDYGYDGQRLLDKILALAKEYKGAEN